MGRRGVSSSSIFTYVFDGVALRMFGDYPARLARSLELDRALRRAGMAVSPVAYAARTLLATTLSVVVALVSGLAVFLLAPLAMLYKAVIVTALGLAPAFTIAAFLTYPQAVASTRAAEVNSELPMFAAYLTTMAYGGVSPEGVIRRVAELKIFKGIREEALRILRDVRIFGMDLLSAIERNVADHVSRRFRDFMQGYVTTVRSGGDILHYLETRTQDIFREEAEELKLIVERVSMFVEVYITVAVIMTIVLYVFFIVGSMIVVGGRSMLTTFMVYGYLGLPLFSTLIIYALDRSMPASPIPLREPYLYLLVTVMPGVLVFFLVLALFRGFEVFTGAPVGLNHIVTVSAALASSLIIISSGPAYGYFAVSRREKKIYTAVASFLRDLTEVRKTGLSPEKSIVAIASRNYGILTPVVRRVAGAISLGVGLEDAVRRAVRGVRNWFLLSIFRFLVDSIDVGGGTPETIDALARFAQRLSELYEELKRRLKTYIAMPYMGAALLAVSSLMIISLLAQAASSTEASGAGLIQVRATPRDVATLTLVTVTSIILNSWMMGLVAGKIYGRSLAAGFVHGIVLTLIVTVIGVAMSYTILSPIL